MSELSDAPGDASGMIARVRRGLDELVGLLGPSATRVGREPVHVARSLLTTLETALALDLVYVQLSDDFATEVGRRASGTSAEPPQALAQVLQGLLGDDSSGWPAFARGDWGAGAGSLAVRRLGLRSELGVLVAGACRPDFPNAAEALLLDIAASQAALALHESSQHIARRSQAKEPLVHAAIDGIPGLVAILAPNGAVEVVNRQALEYFGQSLEDLRNWGNNSTIHVDDRAHVIERFTTSVTAGVPYEIEQRLRRFDGVYRWFSNRGLPARDESNRIVCWYILLTDIDERKQAEEALRERERKARAALHGIPGFVAVLSPAGTVEFVNQRVLEYFGKNAEEAKQWGTNDMVHPEDLPRVVAQVGRAIQTGEPFELDVRTRRHDGVWRWFRSLGSPLRNANGEVIEWYNVLVDIHDSKRAEEALSKARAELARASRFMTLGALAASIAHEVSQPLSGIVTNAQTCLRKLDAQPADVPGSRLTAQRILRDGNRAADVIKHLRDLFARKPPSLEAVNLNDATREVLALLANELHDGRVVLQTDFDAGLPSVLGDRIQLQQVILNLLVNAADAMKTIGERPRQLLVSTGRESPALARLSVRDSGLGVDPETSERLFEPFYTTKDEGMGVGLSISRQIVESLTGQLWVTANEGPGATFSFSIPFEGAQP